MSYFIVFQNKTYERERNGGYLWAPKRTRGGHEIFHWTNMTKVKDGDIIFSMYKRNLVSVNIANGIAVDSTRPIDLDKDNLWGDHGWILKVEYRVLDNPISISDNIDNILKLCPSKYSPFTVNGTGSQGYLFEIGTELGDYLLNLANDINSIDINTISKEEQEKYIEEIDEMIHKFKDETEKKIVVKSRVGQGLFKRKLLSKSCKCEICGLNIRNLLIASHCKPWVKASNKERLDVNNGLLLCPTHDALFDKGLITFNNDGEILISKEIAKSQYNLLNINDNIRLEFRSEQIPYIKYHREKEFLESKKENRIEPKEINDTAEVLISNV